MRLTARALLPLMIVTIASTAWAAEDWVARSNANATPLLEVMAKYVPETAAALGVEGHDTDIIDLKPGVEQRFEADLARAATDLEGRLAAEQDPRVRQDLQILVTAAQDQQTTSELTRRLMLPYYDVAQTLFRGFNALLDARVDLGA